PASTRGRSGGSWVRRLATSRGDELLAERSNAGARPVAPGRQHLACTSQPVLTLRVQRIGERGRRLRTGQPAGTPALVSRAQLRCEQAPHPLEVREPEVDRRALAALEQRR